MPRISPNAVAQAVIEQARKIVMLFIFLSNDPKLSDGGAWRGSCVVERREGIRAREKGGSDETGPS